jgi:hypothetical protein
MKDMKSQEQPQPTKRSHKKWMKSASWDDTNNLQNARKRRATRTYFPMKCSWPHSTAAKRHLLYSTAWRWVFLLVREERLKYCLRWQTRGCVAIVMVVVSDFLHSTCAKGWYFKNCHRQSTVICTNEWQHDYISSIEIYKAMDVKIEVRTPDIFSTLSCQLLGKVRLPSTLSTALYEQSWPL